MPSSIRFSPEPLEVANKPKHRPDSLTKIPKRNSVDGEADIASSLERVSRNRSPFPTKKDFGATKPDTPSFGNIDKDGKEHIISSDEEAAEDIEPPVDIVFTTAPLTPRKPNKPPLRRLPTVESEMPRPISRPISVTGSQRSSSFNLFDRRSPELKLRDRRRNGLYVPNPQVAFGGALADLRR